MAKKITWWEAAEIIGVTDRTMRRWRERLEEDGYDGLSDRRKGKPSTQRVPLATVEKVLRLYQEKYFDLNVRHFHEKLREEHGIELSYTWVKKALQGAGLVAQAAQARATPAATAAAADAGDAAAHRRQQTSLVEDDRWYDLIVILDDATSEIYYAQLVEEESTRTVMAGLAGGDRKQGLVLCAVQRPGQPFLRDAEGGRESGQAPADAGGAGDEGTGGADDSRPTRRRRAGRSRAQLWNLAGAVAAGIAAGGDHDRGSGQPVSAGALHRRSSTRSSRCRQRRRGRRFGGRGRTRPGLDLHGANRAGGGQGQHGSDRGSQWQIEKSRSATRWPAAR